jgi:hypothetical protein
MVDSSNTNARRTIDCYKSRYANNISKFDAFKNVYMNFFKYENYNPVSYNVVISKVSATDKLTILSNAFKFNGKWVNHTAFFKSDTDREKFITWVLLKYS